MEEAAIKRIKDLEMQVVNIRTNFTVSNEMIFQEKKLYFLFKFLCLKIIMKD